MSNLAFEGKQSITEDLMNIYKKYMTKNGYLRTGNSLAGFNSELAIAINKALDNSYDDGFIDGIDFSKVNSIDDIENTRKKMVYELKEKRSTLL